MEKGQQNIFCNLEKRNRENKLLGKIVKNYGEEITNQKQIREEMRDFYKRLYKCNSSTCELNIQEFMHQVQMPKLSKEDASELDEGVTLGEASEVLKNMKSGKSPGPDGFSTVL